MKHDQGYKGPIVPINDPVLAKLLKCRTEGPDPQEDEFPEDFGLVKTSRRR